MRKTLIIGTLMALFGLATAVQASDHRRTGVQDDTQVTRAASNDRDNDDRYEQNDRSRERHDGSHERRHHSHDGHDESGEHEDRH